MISEKVVRIIISSDAFENINDLVILGTNYFVLFYPFVVVYIYGIEFLRTWTVYPLSLLVGAQRSLEDI